MKKRILLSTLTAATIGVILMSNGAGAGTSAGNKTGAVGSTANCGGSGCHGGASAATTAAITIDTAGPSTTAVTQYVPGATYDITVTGSHATNTKFGFQFAAVSGSAPEVHAGAYNTLATGIAEHTTVGPMSVKVIEHTSMITGPLSKTFKWVAPSPGVGNVKMYLTVNAMDGTPGATPGDVSGNVVVTLTQKPTTSVAEVANTATVKAFPNPVVNTLNLQVGNTYSNYSVQVFDITGRNILNTNIEANVTGTTTINTADWAKGLYQVVVSDQNSREVIRVVKQ